MKNWKLFLMMGVAVSLAGCSGNSVTETLGLGRNAPDEFAVVDRPSLALPPDFSLRPPQPGAPRPQEINMRDRATTVVFGNSPLSDKKKPQSSVGEGALLEAAGAAKSEPNIRTVVDREAAEKVVASRRLIDEILWWRKDTVPAATVDAVAERDRLKQVEGQGAPINQGGDTHYRKAKAELAGAVINSFSHFLSGLRQTCAALTLFVLPLSAVPAGAAVFYPETYSLSNGLQVVIVQNKLSPAVAQMVWYKTGAVDEQEGHSGLAHYLEHLMFRGTEQVGPGDYSALIAAEGGTDNAFTSHDYTAYHEIVAAPLLSMAMQMEADRMAHLSITSETATPELSVVLNERDERTDNSPAGKFQEKVAETLFPNHPYGRPIIGARDEIARATPDDARAFYRAHYAPNNAVLVVSGNIEVQEVLRLAAATFGRVPARDVPRPTRVGWPGMPKQKEIVQRDARVQQAQVESLWVAPSFGTGDNKQAVALEVLAELLDGGEVGYLYRALVVQAGVASQVDASYESMARGPSLFEVGLTPRAGVDHEKAFAALDKSLHVLARQGIAERKVQEAKKRLIRAAVFARDSLMYPCQSLGETLAIGGSVSWVEGWPQEVERIKTSDVNMALKKLLSNKRHLHAALLPEVSVAGQAREPARPVLQGGVR